MHVDDVYHNMAEGQFNTFFGLVVGYLLLNCSGGHVSTAVRIFVAFHAQDLPRPSQLVAILSTLPEDTFVIPSIPE